MYVNHSQIHLRPTPLVYINIVKVNIHISSDFVTKCVVFERLVDHVFFSPFDIWQDLIRCNIENFDYFILLRNMY